jgi:Domain of unknown function (DUF4266)
MRPPAMNSRVKATLLLVLVPGALAALAGCSVEPWVKPYEREHIADPIMSFDRDPVSAAYTDHVREAREGARGATGSAGGGCGCN